MENKFQLIRAWANRKGIYEKGDAKTQTLKLMEEVGELSQAILKKDTPEVFDAIGDCVVVLTNVCHLYSKNLKVQDRKTIEDCISGVYSIISERKGEMINGTFVKDE